MSSWLERNELVHHLVLSTLHYDTRDHRFSTAPVSGKEVESTPVALLVEQNFVVEYFLAL